MAQFGDLTTAQQAEYLTELDADAAEPTSAVWLANQGDIDDYVLYIFTDQPLFSARGEGFIGISNATVVLDNIDGTFYSGGNALVKKNDKVKMWAGYGGLNIPIFSGVVRDVVPHFGSDRVTLYCADYFYLFFDAEINGVMPADATVARTVVGDDPVSDSDAAGVAEAVAPQEILEFFCDLMYVPKNVPSTRELRSTYDDPYFERQSMLSGTESVAHTVFHTPLFDENGMFQIYEREYKNPVDFEFNESNTLDLEELAETRIINKYVIEYDDWFYAQAKDQPSIDKYGERAGTRRNVLFDHQTISEKLYGRTEEPILSAYTAIRISSGSGVSLIDMIHLKLSQSGASGYMTVGIYSDVAGLPGELLGLSQLKATATLDTDFAWEIFYFVDAVRIEANTSYWAVLDMSSVSGSLSLLISAASATGKYATFAGGVWALVDDKQPLHKVRSSREAQRVAGDVVRFMKDPSAQIRLTALAGTPHLQRLDEVDVDVELENVRIQGKYVIERKKHEITVNGYESTFYMRKTG